MSEGNVHSLLTQLHRKLQIFQASESEAMGPMLDHIPSQSQSVFRPGLIVRSNCAVHREGMGDIPRGFIPEGIMRGK